jgi:hypothetical protein
MEVKEYLKEIGTGNRWMRNLIKLAEALKVDREMRGFRPDLRVIGTQLDERNGVLWVVLSFSVHAGKLSDKDVLEFAATYFPDFQVDWSRTVGYEKKGIVCVALTPFVERIYLTERKDGSIEIPSGFREIGASLYSLVEADGSTSYWKLIKDGKRFALVRTDGTKPPKVIPPFEAKRKKEEEKEGGLEVGCMVRTPDNQFGIVVAKEGGRSTVRLLGQTKEVVFDDSLLVKYDPERDLEVLRAYYRNVFPDEYIEELLK